MERLEYIDTDDYSAVEFEIASHAIAGSFADEDMEVLESFWTNENYFYYTQHLASTNNLVMFEAMVNRFSIDLDFENNVFLKIAVTNQCDKILSYLLKNGVDVAAENHFAVRLAPAFPRIAILKIILEAGGDAIADNNYPICIAAEHQHTDNIGLLIKHGADINARNSYPLRYAVKIFAHSTLEYLVRNGADVRAGNNYALRETAVSGDPKSLKLLLENGAEVSALTADDLTKVVYEGSHQTKEVLGWYQESIEILMDYGVDFSMVNSWPVDPNITEIIGTLVNSGVDPVKLACILYSRIRIQ